MNCPLLQKILIKVIMWELFQIQMNFFHKNGLANVLKISAELCWITKSSRLTLPLNFTSAEHLQSHTGIELGQNLLVCTVCQTDIAAQIIGGNPIYKLFLKKH